MDMSSIYDGSNSKSSLQLYSSLIGRQNGHKPSENVIGTSAIVKDRSIGLYIVHAMANTVDDTQRAWLFICKCYIIMSSQMYRIKIGLRLNDFP